MNALRFLVCLVLVRCCCTQNDCTTGARILDTMNGITNYGSEVVNTVVIILECSGVFEDDNVFMRRLAYVETRDGAEGQGSTGIWNATKHHLNSMAYGVLIRSFPDLVDQTCEKFGVDMKVAVRNPESLDLTDPLVSGVVARFYLHYVTVQEGLQIPSAEDVNGQAAFWASWFNRTATPQYFTNRVAELKGQIVVQCIEIISLILNDVFFAIIA